MVQPITSSPAPSALPGGRSLGPLKVQLDQVESQLSACLNCDTAHTASGQAKIQRLEALAQALRGRLTALEAPPGPVSPAMPVTGPAEFRPASNVDDSLGTKLNLTG